MGLRPLDWVLEVGGIVLGGGYRCVMFDVMYYTVNSGFEHNFNKITCTAQADDIGVA